LEPYVMAGDVYGHAPFEGKGGWSWYTGAAAWMHRAAVESIFGLKLGATELTLTPCLPRHWNEAEITLKRDGKATRFVLCRGSAAHWLAAHPDASAQTLAVGARLRWVDLLAGDPKGTSVDSHCFVIELL
jgi:cyclic beta-1,2-glucan synthetase